jgi:tetratricopeptide (TPR) repeat protein
MKKTGVLLLLIMTSIIHARACLNDLMLKDLTVISADNSYGVTAGWDGIPTGHTFIERRFPEALKRMDSLWKATKDVDYYSDYALILVLQGKYEEAKKSYLEIEKIKPGKYATASNLGTVYELLGDNNNALKWIKRAIKIDPNSHYGSEWLHVKILEAKINGDVFVTSDFLLNTNFGRDKIPVSQLPGDELRLLKASLVYQLNERMTFIKPTNKIVAQLLFDLANVLTFIEENKENAFIVYEMAKDYGYSEPLVDIRLDYWKRMYDKNPAEKKNAVETTHSVTSDLPAANNDILFYILGGFVGILSIGAFSFFMRKKN